MAKSKRFSNQEFLSGIRDYFPMDARVRETSATGSPLRETSPGALKENTFYYFDAEAMAAIGGVIEDLALEEANGNLFAACQTFQNFDANRERYEQLGVTLDRVEVLGSGKPPRRVRGVNFVNDKRGAGRAYWAVLYQGRRVSVLLVCRQANDTPEFEEKKFAGFYTFKPRIIVRFRADFETLARGQSAPMREFVRLEAIDRVAKEIEGEFVRERAAVNAAFRRLQFDGERYRAGNLESDLEEGLSRLNQCKNRLREVLGRAEAG